MQFKTVDISDSYIYIILFNSIYISIFYSFLFYSDYIIYYRL